MGQRIQIIFRIPEIYYNENNPNNEKEKILVFHNQWLYGINFLKYADRLIYALKDKIKHEKSLPFKTINYNDIIQKSIMYANNRDLSYITNTNIYMDYKSLYNNSDNKYLKESKNIDAFLDIWDNNNGFLYIKIDKKGKISYDIITGFEDSEIRKRVNPKEYLNLFYEDSDMIKSGEYGVVKSIFNLNKVKRINIFNDLKKFQELLK